MKNNKRQLAVDRLGRKPDISTYHRFRIIRSEYLIIEHRNYKKQNELNDDNN